MCNTFDNFFWIFFFILINYSVYNIAQNMQLKIELKHCAEYYNAL